MALRGLLIDFLAYAVYPAWLAAGAGDYLCHRRTRIEATAGTTESWLHVAQLLSILAIMFLAVTLEITRPVLVVMGLAIVCHTALSIIDVSYTQQRRYISPIEQHVHAFLDVLPLIAVALLGLLYWPEAAPGPAFRWKEPMLDMPQQLLLLGSLVVLGGIPVVEELVRTYRVRSSGLPERQR